VRRTPRDFLKVLLLALPVAALAVLFVYLLGKLQAHLPQVNEAPHSFVPATGEAKPAPLYWQNALASSLWLVLLGLMLPLTAAHLWLSAARDGLKATLVRLHRVVGRAFAPQSVLVYAVGFFVFGLMPYFVIYTRTSVSNGWAEMMLFGLRLALAFVLTLWGWAITLGALARLTPPITEAPAAASADTAPALPPPTQEAATAEQRLQA
jgi:branched-subunit amino acid transport protein AzlD